MIRPSSNFVFTQFRGNKKIFYLEILLYFGDHSMQPRMLQFTKLKEDPGPLDGRGIQWKFPSLCPRAPRVCPFSFALLLSFSLPPDDSSLSARARSARADSARNQSFSRCRVRWLSGRVVWATLIVSSWNEKYIAICNILYYYHCWKGKKYCGRDSPRVSAGITSGGNEYLPPAGRTFHVLGVACK